MKKKEYQKPTLKYGEEIDELLFVASQVKSNGLGEDITATGGSGDMEDAWSRSASPWEDEN